MTRTEFARIMAYLAAGIGKPVTAETAEVHFDLLQDLPADAVEAAAKQVLLESEYPVIPLPGVLRRKALAAIGGEAELTPLEAWGLLRRAVVRFGYCQQEQGLASLPPTVRHAAAAMGWQAICDSTSGEDILRAQFTKGFAVIAERRQREQLLPSSVRQLLDNVARPLPVERYPDRRGKPLIRLVDDIASGLAENQSPANARPIPAARAPTAEELDRMRRGLPPRPEPMSTVEQRHEGQEVMTA